jgi:hypothetical protein
LLVAHRGALLDQEIRHEFGRELRCASLGVARGSH